MAGIKTSGVRFVELPAFLVYESPRLRDINTILWVPHGVDITELVRDLAAYEAWEAGRKVVDSSAAEVEEIRARIRKMEKLEDIINVLARLPPLKERYIYMEYNLPLIPEEDILGYPSLLDLLTRPLLPGERKEDAMGLIFVNQLNNPPAVQALVSAVGMLVYKRKIDMAELPPGVRVIAAASPPSTPDQAKLLLVPVSWRTRVVLYRVRAPDVGERIDYTQERHGDE